MYLDAVINPHECFSLNGNTSFLPIGIPCGAPMMDLYSSLASMFEADSTRERVDTGTPELGSKVDRFKNFVTPSRVLHTWRMVDILCNIVNSTLVFFDCHKKR